MRKEKNHFRLHLTAAPDAKWRDDDEVVKPTLRIGAVMRSRGAASRTASIGVVRCIFQYFFTSYYVC